MRIEQKTATVVANGMLETKAFGMNLDGIMFNSLINGIYSDKVAAPIREIATNARDGHALAGCLDKPFDVSLPTMSKPYFEVRDYGASLSHDEVMNMYSVLGMSTKRETDDQTGCLGLGSKSPFAYTNTFSVTCWQEGVCRDYTAFIGADGKPSISLITTIKSNEPRGVRVSFPVKTEDISRFNQIAPDIWEGFVPYPNVINSASNYQKKEKEVFMEGKDWKIFKSGPRRYGVEYKRLRAIQGSVSYPIDLENSAFRTLKKDYAELCDKDMIIFFDIGQLNTTTSREELSYDDKTVQSIIKRIEEVSESIKEELGKLYDKCKTKKEANILYSENMSKPEYKELLRNVGVSQVKWKGITLAQDIVIPINLANDEEFEVELKTSNRISVNYWNRFSEKTLHTIKVKGSVCILSDYSCKAKMGQLRSSIPWKRYNADSTVTTTINQMQNANVVIQIEDKMEGISQPMTMRTIWLNAKYGENIYWFKVSTQTEADIIIDKLYLDKTKVKYLHEQVETKMPSKAKEKDSSGKVIPTKEETTLRVIEPSSWGYSGSVAKYENIDLNSLGSKKLPVVFMKEGRLYHTWEDMENGDSSETWADMERALHRLFRDTGLSRNVMIISPIKKKVYEDHKDNFVTAKKYVIDEWKSKNPNWKNQLDTDASEESPHEFEHLRRKLNMLDKSLLPKNIQKRLKKTSTEIIKKKIQVNDYVKRELLKEYTPQPKNDEVSLSGWVQSDIVLEELLSNFYHQKRTANVINTYLKQKGNK